MENHMKSISFLAFLIALATTPLSAIAADEHHPEAATPRKAAAPSDQMRKMDEQMKTMRNMHEKMMSAKTPEERNALMAEHMKTMRGSMSMMNNMMGGNASGKPMPPQMMQKQMEMSQMMMQMMMDRMEQQPATPVK
jgi:hypothetical protein